MLPTFYILMSLIPSWNFLINTPMTCNTEHLKKIKRWSGQEYSSSWRAFLVPIGGLHIHTCHGHLAAALGRSTKAYMKIKKPLWKLHRVRSLGNDYLMRAMLFEMNWFHVYWRGELEQQLVPGKQMGPFCGVIDTESRQALCLPRV